MKDSLSLIRGCQAALMALLSMACLPAFGLEGAPESSYPSGPVPESDPAFSWTPLPGAAHYRLNVRDAANNFVFNQWFTSAETGCGQGEAVCRVRPIAAFDSASYRWKVIAKDNTGSRSDWSEWLVFFPGQNARPEPPGAPLADQPSGSGDSNRPTFVWQPVADASRYRVLVQDEDRKRVLNIKRNAAPLGCSDGVTACSVQSSKVLSEGSYRWKVRARNKLAGTRGDWSTWVAFTVPSPAALGSGLDQRPANPACTLPEPPPRFSNVRAQRIFTSLPINKLVVLVRPPDSTTEDERWFAVLKDGQVQAFDATDPEVSESELFLDITDRVLDDTGETGLLGLAFHPRFPDENRAFLFYTNKVNGAYESYLSEFLTLDGGDTLDPATERRLITLTGHATHNHKGGTLAFGPDGYLYLGLGDGGTPSESQNPFSLFGSLIRIDVDSGDPYAIPPDNPFVDGLDGAPEIYAYGFRNPWRWTFDPETGFLWLTDVGQSAWEEINIVFRGANYGWPVVEGPDCYRAPVCDTEGLTPPIHSYPHDASGGFVVVGGFVYRGSELPELAGTFVYADGTDRVWALYVDEEGQPDPELLIDGGLSGSVIRSMFEDEDGELYLVKAGFIYRLVRDEEGETGYEFPVTLSETGCVDASNPTLPADGLVPYGVNSAFWTDGAAKRRWLALPDGAAIEVDETGDFHFPPGSVLVKEFSLNGKRIETRLFARHDDGRWAGYTYAWNEDETEAELIESAGRQLVLDGQNYTLPARSECLFCHTEAAGRTLGLEFRQLNRDWHYGVTGRDANQLTTFEAIGLLKYALPAMPSHLPAFVPLDNHEASFSDRARSYLHTNCSSCHRPEGPGQGPADLRYQPLEAMNICDITPGTGDLGIEDARLLAPGAPQRSIIAVRLGSLGPIAMPPVGKNVVDIDATAVVEEWISGLEACPGTD